MKPKILFDARLYGTKHTGIGRYTKNLLLALKKNKDFKNYHWSLLVYPDLLAQIKKDLGNSFSYFTTTIKHYSVSEQILLPFYLYRFRSDLVHFSHFNKPLFYFGKSVVTIHDLIKHFSRGPSTTTRHPILYWPKYLAYLIQTFFTIKLNHIIVPSNFWRDYIISHFHLNPQKITTTYEATDPFFSNSTSTTQNPQNYLVFTGNLYPHKNLNVIFQALKEIPDLKLKIISSRDLFKDQLIKEISKLKIQNQVEFLGFLPDSEFKNIYAKALALVHPSFLEGFSLTGLEAMALNCPVISSNSSCLPEIYQDSVLYFDPNQPKQLIKQIKNLQNNPKLRQSLINRGHLQVKKYSWENTAQLTLNVYHSLLK